MVVSVVPQLAASAPRQSQVTGRGGVRTQAEREEAADQCVQVDATVKSVLALS